MGIVSAVELVGLAVIAVVASQALPVGRALAAARDAAPADRRDARLAGLWWLAAFAGALLAMGALFLWMRSVPADSDASAITAVYLLLAMALAAYLVWSVPLALASASLSRGGRGGRLTIRAYASVGTLGWLYLALVLPRTGHCVAALASAVLLALSLYTLASLLREPR